MRPRRRSSVRKGTDFAGLWSCYIPPGDWAALPGRKKVIQGSSTVGLRTCHSRADCFCELGDHIWTCVLTPPCSRGDDWGSAQHNGAIRGNFRVHWRLSPAVLGVASTSDLTSAPADRASQPRGNTIRIHVQCRGPRHWTVRTCCPPLEPCPAALQNVQRAVPRSWNLWLGTAGTVSPSSVAIQ